MGTGLRAPRHRVQQVGRRVRTSTWDLPGIVEGPEGPADDLHRIGCGTVESPLYGWIDYSPTKHSAAGHYSATTDGDSGVLFLRPYSLSRSLPLSFIHYLHIHLQLQLILTIPIADARRQRCFCALRCLIRCLAGISLGLLSHCITVPALSESSLTAPRQISISLSISHYTPPLLPTPKERTDDQTKAWSDQVKNPSFTRPPLPQIHIHTHICQQGHAIIASFPSSTLPEFPHWG